MAQNPIILDAFQDGSAFTIQLNDAIHAISTVHYGPSDPSGAQDIAASVTDGFLWWDTNYIPAILKVRIVSDPSGWIELLKADGSPGAGLSKTFDKKVSLGAGGTTDGELNTLGASAVIRMHSTYTVPPTDFDVATKAYADGLHSPDSIAFLVQGVILGSTSKVAQRLVDKAGTITECRMYADTAPSGADLVVNIVRQRTATADVSQPVTITDGSNDNSGSETLGVPITVLPFDRIRLDIVSVGSVTAGGDDLLATCTVVP